MSPRSLFAERFDDGSPPRGGGVRPWHGPAPTEAALPFRYPRLEPAPDAAAAPEAEPSTPSFSEAELASAVETARRDACVEAEARLRAEMSASREQRESVALAAIGAALAASREALARALEARAAASRDLALAVARALVAKALASQPLADVEAMFREVLVRIEGEPWLEVRLPPDLAAAGQAALTRIAADSGFQGELRVLAEPGLAPGDARLAWRDGAAERDLARLEAEATALVEAWLPTVCAPPPGVEPVAPDEPRSHGAE